MTNYRRMNVQLLALLGAAALAHTTLAITTCPVSVQSRTTSTLQDPIVRVVPSISDVKDSDLTPPHNGSPTDSSLLDSGGSQLDLNSNVGNNSSLMSSTNGSFGDVPTDTTSTGSNSLSDVVPLPTSTTTDPSPSSTSNTPLPNTPLPTSNTDSPSSSPVTPISSDPLPTSTTSTTPEAPLPVTTTPSTRTNNVASTPSLVTVSLPAASTAATIPTTSSGSSVAEATASLPSARRLQATNPTTAATGTTGTATNVATGTTGTATDLATGTTGTATAANSIGTVETSNSTGTTSLNLGNGATNGAPTIGTTPTATSNVTNGLASLASSSSDSLSCDSTFYSRWSALGLRCGGVGIDVASAVSASSCVIYSGNAGGVAGSTCLSICSFPACTNNAWVYGADNGISSSVYNGLSVNAFLSSDLIGALEERSSSVSTFLSNSTMSDSRQCAYTSENSFSSCSCSAMLVDISTSGSVADAAKKELRQQDAVAGVITRDYTTSAGTVVAATSQSVAGVTVAVTSIAAVASVAVGGASSAGASLAAAGSTMAIATIEVCQFGVLINQLPLAGKSSALALFGKTMAPAMFMYLPFGKLNTSEFNSNSTITSAASRRLSTSNSSEIESPSSASQLTGIEKYSRQLDIREDMLFIVTLAGVFCVMASVLALFGFGYLVAGLMMPREEYLTKFFDKMIGLQVLVAILSQYTIGVTATFQIYYSTRYESIADPKCLFAIAALMFLCAGILVYGYVVVKKHEADIADVGTVQHTKKIVNMRYGPLYEEYKFKNRYFFAAKMMLALTTGVVTGWVSMSGRLQISVILALNVMFFFYLEIQSPHHSKFVQTTTSFVSIMKIAVIVLTFFLVTAATSDGFPTSLQNGISVAIVGLNLFVLALLMIRSLYTFWQKMKLQRNAAYDEEEQTAQDYFKDETPAGYKDHVAINDQHSSGLPDFQPQTTNVNDNNTPYVQNNVAAGNGTADEIRLRSAIHENNDRQQTYDANGHATAKHYLTEDRNMYGQRRNDVVEL